MRHSYTNDTRGDGSVVVKRYEGPDPLARRQREYTALDKLRGRLPVPRLLGGDDGGSLRMAFVEGVHGQELIDDGLAAQVLRSCAVMLGRIHAVDVTDIFAGEPHPTGVVLVHGDYGPNNLLLDPAALTVTAVLDWEWAHPGHPIEDLAWCEWIVRMHHREHIDTLDGFFDAYGDHPTWTVRKDAMLAQCRLQLGFCQRWRASGDNVREWQRRLAVTATWTE